MENYRFLKNIYAKQLANDDASKAIDDGPRGMMVMTTMMTNKIEILVTNMLIPPKPSTPSLAERCL
jgi:hypothetical protein